MVLEARLKVKSVEGSLRQVCLATDPRLTLQDKDRGPAPRVETIPGQPRILRFELPQSAPGQRVLQVSFLLAEHPGVGVLRLPYCDVLDARTTKRWLAVLVDPRLEHEQRTGVGVRDGDRAFVRDRVG